MAQPSDRLARRVRRDFSADEADRIVEHLVDVPESLPLGGTQDPERLQASIVLAAHGDYQEFLTQLDLASVDWRDTLMKAGLGEADWQSRLDGPLAGESCRDQRRRASGG